MHGVVPDLIGWAEATSKVVVAISGQVLLQWDASWEHAYDSRFFYRKWLPSTIHTFTLMQVCVERMLWPAILRS